MLESLSNKYTHTEKIVACTQLVFSAQVSNDNNSIRLLSIWHVGQWACACIECAQAISSSARMHVFVFMCMCGLCVCGNHLGVRTKHFIDCAFLCKHVLLFCPRFPQCVSSKSTLFFIALVSKIHYNILFSIDDRHDSSERRQFGQIERERLLQYQVFSASFW